MSLFCRMNQNQEPLDCCFLEFSDIGISSPCIDLNAFMFTCLEPKMRRRVRARALELYHEEYEKIMTANGRMMTFTCNELNFHMKKKQVFAILFFTSIFWNYIRSLDSYPQLSEIIHDGDQSATQKASMLKLKEVCRLAVKHPLAARFLAMFDDIKETGFFHLFAER